MPRQRAAETVHLVNRVVENLPAGDGSSMTYYDDATPGLTMRVARTGRRTWVYYRSHFGRPVRVALGTFPEMSATEARDAATRKAGEYATGGPRPVALAREEVVSLGELWAAWHQDAEAHGKRTLRNDEMYWRDHWSQWAGLKVGQISRRMVAQQHLEYGERAPVKANRALALIRRLYNWGEEMGLLRGVENPAMRIRHFRERSRERFLSREEWVRLSEELESEATPPYLRDFVGLAVATGQRKGNVLAMAWADVDLDQGTWAIAGEETKNGEPLVVPLMPEALAVLVRRREERGPDELWVFPGLGTKTHMMDLKRSFNALKARAKIEGLRLHDLRRTLGSWMAMSGASLPMIGKALGHKSQAATAIYARLQLDPVRAAMAAGRAAMDVMPSTE